MKRLKFGNEIHKITLSGTREFYVSQIQAFKLFSNAILCIDNLLLFENDHGKQTKIQVLAQISEKVTLVV